MPLSQRVYRGAVGLREATVSTQHHDAYGQQVPPPPSFPPPPKPDLQVIHDTPRVVIRKPQVVVSEHRTRPHPYASGLRLGDKRGLTGLGAVSLVVLFAAVAGAIDGHRAGNGLGLVFGVVFVLGCLVAALVAHTEDMGAIAILPPLAFVVGALACAAFRPSVVGVPFASQMRNEVLIAMLLGAPALFVAEAVTLVTTGLRGLRYRAIRRARSAAR
jgi:hypothetical protein